MTDGKKTNKLNITDQVLTKLGFSEYWDEHGTWGGRTLTFKDGTKLRIIEQEEMDDDTEGYALDGVYIAHHFYFAGWFAWPPIVGYHDLYFLHDLYNCIKQYYPHCLEEFIEKCNSVKMGTYLNEI